MTVLSTTSGTPGGTTVAPTGGLVTFRLGERDYCTPLVSVREVVRLQGLADLPGMEPPLAGVLDLRGTALPVLDLRLRATSETRGDVLVVEREGHLIGIAVDRVSAVVAKEDLPPAGTGSTADGTDAGVLPGYVTEVLRGPSGPVFLVDLEAMVDSVRRA
jgi:purine-binding chemotaxis protein CheW